MKARLFPILVVCLSLLASACGGKSNNDPTGQAIKAATSYNLTHLKKPWTPKAWTGTALDGTTLNSDSFRGSVTVVNFWASWCGPCRVEQAALQRLSVKYVADGVRFLGVDVRDKPTNAKAHLEEFGVTYPSVSSPDSRIAFKYHVRLIPTTLVLDKEGRVAWQIVGATREPDLTRSIEEEIAA